MKPKLGLDWFWIGSGLGLERYRQGLDGKKVAVFATGFGKLLVHLDAAVFSVGSSRADVPGWLLAGLAGAAGRAVRWGAAVHAGQCRWGHGPGQVATDRIEMKMKVEGK